MFGRPGLVGAFVTCSCCLIPSVGQRGGGSPFSRTSLELRNAFNRTYLRRYGWANCKSLDSKTKMTISTRTPEGDPLKCVVCGKEHLVLSSNPSGDSVCPTCGSHSWILSKKTEAQFPTAEVIRIVPVFVDKIRLSRSKMEMAAHLVDGLFQCLSPQGVTLWLMGHSVGIEPTHFDLAASRGEAHTSDFAFAVSIEKLATMQIANTNLGQRLVIRVPLVEKNKLKVVGILEVVQRTDIPFDAREGSLRFVRSMVAVSSGCRALSNLEFETS